MRGRAAVHEHDVRRQLAVRRARVRGCAAGRRARAPSRPPGPGRCIERGSRQVRRVRHPVVGGAQPGRGGPTSAGRPRPRPAARPGCRPRAATGRPARPCRYGRYERVGQVEVGQLAGRRVEHAERERAGAVPARPAARRPAAAYQRAAEHPQRAAELLLARAQRAPARRRPAATPVEVPPAGPVADRVQVSVVGPFRLQHRLVRAAEQRCGPDRRRRPAELGDPQLGAVPRHLRVVPGDPGHPPAVRREPRVRRGSRCRRRSTRTAPGSSAPEPSSGTATMLARDRRPRRAPPARTNLVAARAEHRVGVAQAGRLGRLRGERHRLGAPGVEPVDPLVGRSRRRPGAPPGSGRPGRPPPYSCTRVRAFHGAGSTSRDGAGGVPADARRSGRPRSGRASVHHTSSPAVGVHGHRPGQPDAGHGDVGRADRGGPSAVSCGHRARVAVGGKIHGFILSYGSGRLLSRLHFQLICRRTVTPARARPPSSRADRSGRMTTMAERADSSHPDATTEEPHRHERPEDWGWNGSWGKWARIGGWISVGRALTCST